METYLKTRLSLLGREEASDGSDSPSERLQRMALVERGGQAEREIVFAMSLGKSVQGSKYLSASVIATTSPEEGAMQLLRDIRFQPTYTTGYSGKLGTGSLEMAADTSYKLVAKQESFPDIIALGWRAQVPVEQGLRETYAALVEEFERVAT